MLHCPIICFLPSVPPPLYFLYIWLSNHTRSLPAICFLFFHISVPTPFPFSLKSSSTLAPLPSSSPYLPASLRWASLSSQVSVCIFPFCLLLLPFPSLPPPTSLFLRPPALRAVWETFLPWQRPLWLSPQPAPLLQSRIHLVSRASVWPCRGLAREAETKDVSSPHCSSGFT